MLNRALTLLLEVKFGLGILRTCMHTLQKGSKVFHKSVGVFVYHQSKSNLTAYQQLT